MQGFVDIFQSRSEDFVGRMCPVFQAAQSLSQAAARCGRRRERELPSLPTFRFLFPPRTTCSLTCALSNCDRWGAIPSEQQSPPTSCPRHKLYAIVGFFTIDETRNNSISFTWNQFFLDVFVAFGTCLLGYYLIKVLFHNFRMTTTEQRKVNNIKRLEESYVFY